MQLTENQKRILGVQGHLLVTGGPGSGKTTIAIMKAAQVAEHATPGQRVLFLSFARATVSRIFDAIEYEQEISREQKRRIQVETYHSFFWRILKAHGYLVGLPRRVEILTPAGEAIALSGIRSRYPAPARRTDAESAAKIAAETVERCQLARVDGRICFDLFAPYVGDILNGSARIRRLLAAMYPLIVLDEFQDTNVEQWHVVRGLGEFSSLLALADPEQRIYDFIGADPERLDHFTATFAPTEIDLSSDNHRSVGTDIGLFGNDILTGQWRQTHYQGIECLLYEPYAQPAMSALVTTTYSARKRLVDSGRKNWSLAILVPTKKMTRVASDALRSPPAGLTAIPHEAAVEFEAAILGAEVIAFLMQPDLDGRHFERFVSIVCNYFHGRGGGAPTQGDIKEAAALQKAYADWGGRLAAGKTIKKNSVLVALMAVHSESQALSLTGDPDCDWRAIRVILGRGECPRMQGVAEDVRSLRLLERGTQLRQDLSQDWRDRGVYANALDITRRAFLREHFSTKARPESGVVVMNMHQAKGKQFDEVIIFEGWPRVAGGKVVANADRIVRSNTRSEITEQARQNLRVSVTRAKQRTTILTPKSDPCILLVADRTP